MLSTFKTSNGVLIIRSEDIKAIEDDDEAKDCTLTYLIGSEVHERVLVGTALENLAHIQREELDGIDRVASYQEAQQRRQMAGMPAVPVMRGKQR